MKKIYRGRWYPYAGSLLFLVIPAWIALSLPSERLTFEAIIGLSVFSGIFIAMAVVPTFVTLEVSFEKIQTKLLGFTLTDISTRDVTDVQIKKLLKVGLGAGKAAFIDVVRNGHHRRYTIGEKLYGEGAIDQIKRITN